MIFVPKKSFYQKNKRKGCGQAASISKEGKTTNLTIEELKAELLKAELVDMFHQAYQQGVEDCRESMKFENNLPTNLRKEHVAKIFQVELPTVEKIIRMDGFPKCHAVAARYPKDKVLEWASKNAMYMNERLGIHVSHQESLRLLRA